MRSLEQRRGLGARLWGRQCTEAAGLLGLSLPSWWVPHGSPQEHSGTCLSAPTLGRASAAPQRVPSECGWRVLGERMVFAHVCRARTSPSLPPGGAVAQQKPGPHALGCAGSHSSALSAGEATPRHPLLSRLGEVLELGALHPRDSQAGGQPERSSGSRGAGLDPWLAGRHPHTSSS